MAIAGKTYYGIYKTWEFRGAYVMSIQKSIIVALVVCALAAVLPVAGYAADEGEKWTIYFRPGVRVSNHDRMIGYFDFLVPLSSTDKSVLYFNPRANFDNNDNVEWNVGVGYRHLLANDKLILGGNLYYDGRKSYTGNDFHQIGVGAEVLTEWVNGRVNGYISLSDAKEGERWREYYFGSTSLNYSWAYSLEEPMSGLDYEIGFKIPGLSNYVETWVYGGGYNYFSDYTDDMAGWSARVEVIPTDFVKLNFSVRDDNLRPTEYAAEVALELPFSIDNLVAGKDPFEGLGDVFKGSRTMKERLYEQVRRDVDITVNTINHTRATTPGDVIPGDPGDFSPMLFVNPAGGGDGSFEDPMGLAAALAAAGSGDIIFVNAGTYNLGSTAYIPDGVTLLGQGYDPYGIGYTLQAPVLSAPGSIPPGLTSGWFRGAFHMGNGTGIMGFSLTNTSTAANNPVIVVVEPGGTVSNVLISHNTITNEASGIALYRSTGITITGNTINVDSSTVAGDTNNNGILVYGETHDLLIDGNTITARLESPVGGWSDAIGIYFSWASPFSDNVTITNNAITVERVGNNTNSSGTTEGIGMWFNNHYNTTISGNTINMLNGVENYGIIGAYSGANAEVFGNTINNVVPSGSGNDLSIYFDPGYTNVNVYNNTLTGF
jgi:parallel beta-helix repeat protein